MVGGSIANKAIYYKSEYSKLALCMRKIMRHTHTTISGWKFHRDERSEILIKMAPLPLLLLTFAATTWIEDLWMKGLFCKKERLKNKQTICQSDVISCYWCDIFALRLFLRLCFYYKQNIFSILFSSPELRTSCMHRFVLRKTLRSDTATSSSFSFPPASVRSSFHLPLPPCMYTMIKECLILCLKLCKPAVCVLYWSSPFLLSRSTSAKDIWSRPSNFFILLKPYSFLIFLLGRRSEGAKKID